MTARALGWCRSETVLPPPYELERLGRISLVTALPEGTGAREVLAQQITLERLLESYVPTNAALADRLEDTVRWSSGVEGEILDRLDALEGKTQVTMAFEMPEAIEPERDGKTWLRNRAIHLEEETELSRQLRRATDAILSFFDVTRSALRQREKNVILDLLLPRDGIQGTLARLEDQARTIGLAQLPGWNCTIVGPLPAYAFCDFPDLEPCDG
ncbi:MAG: hypothetical protein AAF871_04230 [Pseudomonadota bacterium]